MYRNEILLSIIQSSKFFFYLKLKISTAEPIGFYSSGNVPTGPVVVLGSFLGGWYQGRPSGGGGGGVKGCLPPLKSFWVP